MPVYSIINEPDRQILDPAKVERRAVPRLPAPQIESRIRARLLQFLCVVAVGSAWSLWGTTRSTWPTPWA